MMIKQIRTDILKLSQVDLAARLKMTQANLSRLESGKQKVTPEIAIKIEQISNGEIHRSLLRPDIFEAAKMITSTLPPPRNMCR